MTPATLIAWRKRLSWNKAEATRRLGLSRTSYDRYEAGKTTIPLYIALACNALAHGLPAYGLELKEDEKGIADEA